ncbi:DNA helicase-2/ATP-dependent DNA helicase PcrA [Luteibacter sp. 1214]|uniref:ATP-dependent helicase n=1 Tax=Luteibacter sp. 1214 TaxID=2817735 RepID=UPI002856CB36|nr:ATP-dependent helicase [Luteibacter sp. 1214]MDR6640888.1 DNA helicase-2/ATP-dependent DNA helicase PcrA [Luteibacter sp. 1214]
MALVIDEDRQRILDATETVLVTGGPGSGKTTIALAKAQRVVEGGLSPGQHVLFLSFSRAAVARVVDASKLQLPKALQARLSIQTFHSLFWEILQTYGYLLGTKRRLELLLPQDEKALKNFAESQDLDWNEERERLFREEGKVSFDLFAEKTRLLLERSARIRRLVAARFPLIVVDESQDTANDQWACVRLLAEHTQLICLADLDQQIYDFREGVSADRVNQILDELHPIRVDLQGQNHRSPDSEISTFGNDILLGTPRGSGYRGVSQIMFRPDAINRNNAIRMAVGRALTAARAAAGEKPIESMAILATWGRGVNLVSQALREDGARKGIPHRVVFDEAAVLLSSRLVAFLMEPRRGPEQQLLDVAEALDLSAGVFRARGKKGNLAIAAKLAATAIQCRSGKKPGANTAAGKLLQVVAATSTHTFSGDPKRDWLDMRGLIRQSGNNDIASISKDVDQLVLFQRGQRIANGFTELWQRQGEYAGARASLDAALAEDYLLSGRREAHGIHVMTIHASKGKEFDVVIVFDDHHSCPLDRNEAHPHQASRRLFRVAITRAKHHVLVLNDRYTPTVLMQGHNLAPP